MKPFVSLLFALLAASCSPPELPTADRPTSQAVAKAVEACKYQSDLSECLLGQANLSSPPNMEVCEAAADAKKCIQANGIADLCPGIAGGGLAKCTIVFD